MENRKELTQIVTEFRQLIEGEKLIFLAGAGCSIEEPSCLPAAKQTMKALVRCFCIEKEKKYILQKVEQGKIRFEAFIENLQDNIDTDLKIIDFYGLSQFPNIQHFFLAKMIEQGHFVMTTNFDYLIEYAFAENKIVKDKIIPVITKTDYEKYNNPAEMFLNGYKAIYKIHGSVKNIITNEDTSHSLITTIRALGKNKEGVNIFQLEPFKRQLFENISIGRTLIIMGYSGGDDFDIVPTFKILKNLNKIIWITHINNKNQKESSSEISSESIDSSGVHEILSEVKRFNPHIRIYELKVNTTQLVKRIIGFTHEISDQNFELKIDDWIPKQFPNTSELVKYKVTIKVLEGLNDLNRALRNSKKMVTLSKTMKDIQCEIDARILIGEYLFKLGRPRESMVYFNDLARIVEENAILEVNSIHSIGDSFLATGRVDEVVLDRFESDLTRVKKSGWSTRQGRIYINMGKIYKESNDLETAIEYITTAWMQACTLDDHMMEIETLINWGDVFREKFHYDDALEKYLEALKVVEINGELKYKSILLSNIGQLYVSNGNFADAIKSFQEALDIADKLGDYINKIYILSNLSHLLHNQRVTESALDYFNELSALYEKVGGRFRNDTSILIEAGLNLYTKASVDDTLNYLHKALQFAKSDKNNSQQALILSIQGEILASEIRVKEGISKLKKALAIANKTKNPEHNLLVLKSIYSFVKFRDKLDDKLIYTDEVLTIIDQLVNCRAKLQVLGEIGKILEKKGQLDEALDYYKSALILSEKEKIFKQKHDFSDKFLFLHRSFQHLRKEENHELLSIDPKMTIIDDSIISKQEIQFHIGKILQKKCQFDEAEAYYQEGYIFAKREKNYNYQAAFLISFSELFWAKKDVGKTLDYVEKLAHLVEEFEDKERRETILGLINYLFEKEDSVPSLLSYIAKILHIIKQLGPCENKFYTLNYIGGLLLEASKFNMALEYSSEALRIAKLEGNAEIRNKILRNRRVILIRNGFSLISVNRIREGLENCWKAFDISEQLEDYQGKIESQYSLLVLLARRGYLTEARKCAAEIAETLSKTENFEGLDEILSSISPLLV